MVVTSIDEVVGDDSKATKEQLIARLPNDCTKTAGDTLFSAGCGRFFEGTPPEMYKAMIEILANLPAKTRVFCGHEYTVQCLKYAEHVEPENADIHNKLEWAQSQRASNLPTIPSTIEEEKKINPFMRVREGSVHKHVGGATDPIEVMRLLRLEKDTFKAKF